MKNIFTLNQIRTEVVLKGGIKDVTILYSDGRKEEHAVLFSDPMYKGGIGISHKCTNGYNYEYLDQDDYGDKFTILIPEGYQPILKK